MRRTVRSTESSSEPRQPSRLEKKITEAARVGLGGVDPGEVDRARNDAVHLLHQEVAEDLGPVRAEDGQRQGHVEHVGLARGQVAGQPGDVRLAEPARNEGHDPTAHQVVRVPADQSGRRSTDGDDAVRVVAGDDALVGIPERRRIPPLDVDRTGVLDDRGEPGVIRVPASRRWRRSPASCAGSVRRPSRARRRSPAVPDGPAAGPRARAPPPPSRVSVHRGERRCRLGFDQKFHIQRAGGVRQGARCHVQQHLPCEPGGPRRRVALSTQEDSVDRAWSVAGMSTSRPSCSAR